LIVFTAIHFILNTKTTTRFISKTKDKTDAKRDYGTKSNDAARSRESRSRKDEGYTLKKTIDQATHDVSSYPSPFQPKTTTLHSVVTLSDPQELEYEHWLTQVDARWSYAPTLVLPETRGVLHEAA
jgi:hypothetical protein